MSKNSISVMFINSIRLTQKGPKNARQCCINQGIKSHITSKSGVLVAVHVILQSRHQQNLTKAFISRASYHTPSGRKDSNSLTYQTDKLLLSISFSRLKDTQFEQFRFLLQEHVPLESENSDHQKNNYFFKNQSKKQQYMYKTLLGKKIKRKINQSLLVHKYESTNFVKSGSQDTEGGPLGDESK